MADLYNAAFYGAEVRRLIGRGENVHWKNVRRRLVPRARRAPASSPRARSAAKGTSRLGQEDPK